MAALQGELGRALLLGLLPCVVSLDEVTFEESGARELVRDVLRRHPGPVAVRLGVEGTAPFPAGHLVLDLPALNEGERLEVWTKALAANRLTAADPALLAARHRSGPGLAGGFCGSDRHACLLGCQRAGHIRFRAARHTRPL